MSSIFCRAHSRCFSLSRLGRPRITVFLSKRFATHRDPLRTSQLSQSLDTKYQPLRPDQKVGPFQMGINESPFATPKPTKWADLSTGGKVKRTTARTSNLIVIVFGAGLTAVLLYAVTSELFSKNSPTVLYGQSCEKIKASPQVAEYLHGPLSFHMTPPSAERPRGRQHQVASQIFMDSNGRERMVLNFFVQGSLPQSEDSYFNAATNWISDTAKHLPELTLDDAIQGTKDRSANAWEKFVQSFKYLVGVPAPRLSASESSPPPANESSSNPTETESNTQKWTGIFSSLRKTRTHDTSETVQSLAAPGTVYTDGEVHAEFIRNDDGYFVCRYIFIDLPNSRSRKPLRIFVERTAGLRENEPVLRRYS